MKKILFIIFILLATPSIVLAAYNDVMVLQAVNLILPGNGLSYTLQTTTNVESITIESNTFSFVMPANSVFEIQSTDKSRLSHTNSTGCVVLTDSCSGSDSTLKMQCNIDGSITVTPGASSSCTVSPGGGGFSGGGGGSSAVPHDDSTTVVANLNNPFPLEISGTTHTVNITSASDSQIIFSIYSEPMVISLARYESKDLDTDGDGTNDLRVTYSGLQGGRAQLKFLELAQVTLEKELVTVEEVKEEIKGISASECILEASQAFKHAQSNAVWYITKDCKKRAFNNSRVFFTYFNGWSDVNVVQQASLDDLADDDLGFMPWGPKYDPKYGALVKIVSDPKVYLLLGTEKYWITNEDVFNTLGYQWNWIEDIDEALLDKYTLGTEINYTDRHPNFTLIKYLDDPKVYKLEDGKKRHVVDEQAFESLGYRWDRIVTVEDSEEYADGEELSVE